MFKKVSGLYYGIKSTYNKQGIPKISGTILITSLGLATLGKSTAAGRDKSFLESLKIGANKLLDTLTYKQEVPTLPKTNTNKPVCIFDLDNFLIHKSYSFWKFRNIVYKRPFAQTFLFHMAHFYELVLLTEHNIHEGQKIISAIDPYGCIMYRVFVKDKKLFTMDNLNRDVKQLINIKTIDTKPVFNDNVRDSTIEIPKWKGAKDAKLLDLLSFCTNMAILNVPDYRSTITSYKNTNFFDTFNFVQKKIFKQRNMFTWDYDKAYNDKLKEINDERIETFEKAKLEMEQQIIRDKLYNTKFDIFTKIHNIVLNLIL